MKGSSAYKISIVTILVNLVLFVFKFVAGVLSGSGAMISDAVHSASDVFSTVIVIIGIKISSKEEDSSHPYGHDRFECVTAVFLAVVLTVTGVLIGIDGVQKIIHSSSEIVAPTSIALVAAVVSIAVKEAMFWYTKIAAKRLNSGALMADAWHHRSDALSSVGSLIGIGGAMLGVLVLEPIASVVICLFILKAAFHIIRDAIDKLVDKSCDKETCDKLLEAIKSVNGVQGVDNMKTRQFGNKMYVEVEICCMRDLTLFEAHAIAHKVHDKIETDFPLTKHCSVHVNPFEVPMPVQDTNSIQKH